MFKTKLEKKIHKIGLYFVLAFLAYLFIAFLLLSKYPFIHYVFDTEKCYEVIKDGLTLAATFLASVVAFVLFNHWSEQHSSIRNETDVNRLLKVTEGIRKEIDDIQDYITGYYETGITVEDLIKYENKVNELLPRIHTHFDDLVESAKNFTNSEFHKLCCKVHQNQLNFLYKITALVQTRLDLENSKVDSNNQHALPGLILQDKKVSDRYFKNAATYTLYIEEVKPQIDKLADQHRIK